ncbi:MAG: hypothetical protein R3F40_15940 [Candidatus Competibacteraceae bacterium]
MAKKKRPTLEATGVVVAREVAGDVTLVAVLLLLVMSGIAGLVYQLLWVKQLSGGRRRRLCRDDGRQHAFFAGLAGGSYGFGKRADRLPARFVFTRSWGNWHWRPGRIGDFADQPVPRRGSRGWKLTPARSPGHFPFVLVGLPAV